MVSSFSDLKRNRNSLRDKILEESNKVKNAGSNGPDSRFWTPTVDQAGNGYAVIRFLPPPKGEDMVWVRLFSHGFQGPGGWYIENSLTTLNKEDPVGELNSQLWNRGDEAGKEQARKQKRRLSYISNILVVKDPANPANDGKAFLFKYGKKIWDKINDLMNPEFEDEDPVNPFDFWEGANFKLKIRNVEGYRNYDKSEFDKPSPISEDDDALEKIWSSQYSLTEFTDPKNFKTYAELKARLTRVLGTTAPSTSAEETDLEEEEEVVEQKPKKTKEAAPKKDKEEAAPWDDDEIDFFKSLGEE